MKDRFKPRLTNAMIFIMILAVSLVYWMIDRFSGFIPTYDFNDLLDGPLMVLSALVVWYYSPGIFQQFHDKTTQLYVLKVGIVLTWFSTLTWRLSRFLYAEGIFGKATIGVHDSWRGYMIALSVLAGVIHLFAIDMQDDGSFSRRYVYICFAAIVGGMAAIPLFKIFISGTMVPFW